MRQLPERPNLDQLRRQARELQRAARAGMASAVRRIRAVSKGTSLSAAQLTMAREYGFASWERLKTEVERRAGSRQPSPPQAKPVMRTWEAMREWMASLVNERTGKDVGAWKRRMAEHRFKGETALRRWLGIRGFGDTVRHSWSGGSSAIRHS